MAAPLGQREHDAHLRLARDPDGSVTCRSCGARWVPRVEVPRKCPECFSTRWFRDTYAAGRRVNLDEDAGVPALQVG